MASPASLWLVQWVLIQGLTTKRAQNIWLWEHKTKGRVALCCVLGSNVMAHCAVFLVKLLVFYCQVWPKSELIWLSFINLPNALPDWLRVWITRAVHSRKDRYKGWPSLVSMVFNLCSCTHYILVYFNYIRLSCSFMLCKLYNVLCWIVCF